jgi:16S rRNA (cytidine1402-2'-O)-methyltransferase
MDDSNKTKKTLVLIPNYLGIKHPDALLPQYYHKAFDGIELIFCESFKSADAMLSRQNLPMIELFEINEHSKWNKVENEVMMLLATKQRVGVMSDAGLPCIADPGEKVVSLAHSLGYEIEVLPGANSMILALAASGLNGELFRFGGYVPIDVGECKKTVVEMSQRVKQYNETQLFMETPYRNEKLLLNLLNWLPDTMKLCIAADLLGKESFVKSCAISEWKTWAEGKDLKLIFAKKPAVFVIGQ